MNRYRLLIAFVLILQAPLAFAIEGSGPLERKLLESHGEIQALEREIGAQESFVRASRSQFYPTLNVAGGWAQDKELTVGDYKGVVGFIDGRFNLFRGFKDQAFIEQAKTDLELKKLEFETKKRSLKVQLTEALAQMIYVHQMAQILDEEIRFTQSQRQMASKKVSAGLTGSVDNVEFDLRDNEIAIQKRQLIQFHDEAHEKLNALFSAKLDDNELETLTFSSVQASGVSWEPKSTIGFMRAELLTRRARSERAQARADFLPSVDLDYRFGHLTPGVTDTVKFDESRVGFLVTIPLFSGFDTISRTNAQTLNVQAQERTQRQLVSDVAAELNTLKFKFQELSDLNSLNDKQLTSAKKYYDLTLGEYRRGIKNSPDVVTATERWFSAQKRSVEIKKDFENLRSRIEGYF